MASSIFDVVFWFITRRFSLWFAQRLLGQVEVLSLTSCTRDISRRCELHDLKTDKALAAEWN